MEEVAQIQRVFASLSKLDIVAPIHDSVAPICDISDDQPDLLLDALTECRGLLKVFADEHKAPQIVFSKWPILNSCVAQSFHGASLFCPLENVWEQGSCLCLLASSNALHLLLSIAIRRLAGSENCYL